MGVLCTFVRSSGDNGRILLVGHVIDCERVLVVSVTDIAAKIFCVRALILEALSIVDVAVLRSTAWAGGVGGIRQIDEDESRRTCGVAREGANTYGISKVFVDDNVVGCTI